jgi:hypothetical protein
MPLLTKGQCCGSESGSGRIRTFFPDPEISPPNPDPDPALVVLKKYRFLCNIVHMYIYLLHRCDSSIGIGKATRLHEFNNDEIGFCLVLGIICHSMYQY